MSSRIVCGLAVGLLGISLSELIADGSTEVDGKTQKSQAQLQLDHSFTVLQESIATRELDPEDARDAMYRWFVENGQEIELLKEEEKVLREAELSPAPEIPDLVPVLPGSDPADFLEAAFDYHTQATAAISHGAKTPEDFERVRDALAAFHAEEINQQLEKDLIEARKVVARNAPPERLPLGAGEIAALSEEERLEEEIYAKQYEVTRAPLQEGEDLRDRLAGIEKFVDDRQQRLSEIRAPRHLEKITAKRIQLEQELINEKD